MERRETFWRIVLLAPALIVFSIFVLWPLLDSFRYSFTNWNGFNPNYKFVGLDNFAKVFSDPNFFTAIINTAIWMVAALVLPTLLGFALALLLNTGLRGASIFKSIFYLPICLSAVIVGQIWIWIYQPDWGLLNTVIARLHRPAAASPSPGWPNRRRHSAPSSSPGRGSRRVSPWSSSWPASPRSRATCWRPPTSTASSRWKQTLHIVLPMLRPATIVVIALSVINSLKGFDILYIMTGGGPFHSSNTLAFFMYEESFKKYRMGYGSAIAVVLFLIALSIIFSYFRQIRKMHEIYD